jgi:hypothetical protein
MKKAGNDKKWDKEKYDGGSHEDAGGEEERLDNHLETRDEEEMPHEDGDKVQLEDREHFNKEQKGDHVE